MVEGLTVPVATVVEALLNKEAPHSWVVLVLMATAEVIMCALIQGADMHAIGVVVGPVAPDMDRVRVCTQHLVAVAATALPV